MSQAKLIVGLGNPGKQYEETRHNMGFLVVDELARKFQVEFKSKSQLLGQFAKISTESGLLIFLKPSTYMNLSGQSVGRCKDFFKVQTSDILVIFDDIYLPFGKLRLKDSGQSGGHNGIKSIDAQIEKNYTRLKVGIGNPDYEDLSSFVLGKFRASEFEALPSVIESAAEVATVWCKSGIKAALESLSKVSNDQKPRQGSEE